MPAKPAAAVCNNPKLLTIFRICYGLNMTISEFFNDKIFENLDLDI